eukprot:scaffold80898_cov31-Attheya_sp.AAC.1
MITANAGSSSHSEQSTASISSDSTGSWFTPSIDDSAVESDFEFELFTDVNKKRSIRRHEEAEEYITNYRILRLIQLCTLLLKLAIQTVTKRGVISRPGCHQIEL